MAANLLCVYLSITAPLLPPFNVSGYGLNATSLVLSWEDIPLIGRNGIIRGFYVKYSYVDSKKGLLGESKIIDVNNSTYGIFIPNDVTHNSTYVIHITNLTRDSYYNISVAGFTNAGIGVYSQPKKIETGPYGNFKFCLKLFVCIDTKNKWSTTQQSIYQKTQKLCQN